MVKDNTKEIIKSLNNLYNGSITILRQDRNTVQYNVSEKIYYGGYLCR